MKSTNRSWGTRVAALIVVILAFIFFGQIFSFGWMVITGALSLAVWMLIWLWPERVPGKAERLRASEQFVTKNDSYAGRN